MLIALIIIQFASCFVESDVEHSYSPQVYEEYVTQYEGEYTPEKRAAIGLLIVIIPVFCNEYSSSAGDVILTTKIGRRATAVSKLVVVLGFTFVFSMVMNLIGLILFIWQNSDAFGNYSLFNLLDYNGFGDTTIIGYYIKSCLIKSVAWCCLSVFICMLSTLIRNTIFVYFISFVCCVCPALITDIVQINSFGYIFASAQLADMYTYETSLPVLFGIYIIKTVCYFAVCIAGWTNKLATK